MNYRLAILTVAFMMFAIPALAVDDFYGPESTSTATDSRRPDLGIGTTGDALESLIPSGAGSSWEEFYSQELDLAPLMGRLFEVMTREEWLGQYPEAKQLAEIMKNQGFFNLSRMQTSYAITGDSISFMSSESYADLDPNSYYAKLMALPNQPLVTANYISDDYMLYLGWNNVPALTMILLDELASNPALQESGASSEMGLGDLQSAKDMIETLQIEQLINNIFTGEVGLVIYDLPPLEQCIAGDIMPDEFDAALMLGVKDPALVMENIERYGSEAGLQGLADSGDGWRYFTMQGQEGLGLILGSNIVLATTNLDQARKHIEAAKTTGGLSIADCLYFCDFNAEQIHEKVLAPAVRMAQAELAKEDIQLPMEAMAYLVNLPGSDSLGHIVVSSTGQPDGYTMTGHMNKAILQYLAYYLGVGLCGAGQAGAFD